MAEPPVPSAPPSRGAAVAETLKSAGHRTGRWALLAGAVLLLALAVYQAVGYVGAALALSNSGLLPFYKSAFKALWLGMALQTALVAVLVFIGALQPTRLSGPALVITSLIPLTGAALLAAFLSSFVGTVVLVVAAILVLTGALLR